MNKQHFHSTHSPILEIPKNRFSVFFYSHLLGGRFSVSTSTAFVRNNLLYVVSYGLFRKMTFHDVGQFVILRIRCLMKSFIKFIQSILWSVRCSFGASRVGKLSKMQITFVEEMHIILMGQNHDNLFLSLSLSYTQTLLMLFDKFI